MLLWNMQRKDAELFTTTLTSDGKSGECNPSLNVLNEWLSFEMHYASCVTLIPLPSASKSLAKRQRRVSYYIQHAHWALMLIHIPKEDNVNSTSYFQARKPISRIHITRQFADGAKRLMHPLFCEMRILTPNPTPWRQISAISTKQLAGNCPVIHNLSKNRNATYFLRTRRR